MYKKCIYAEIQFWAHLHYKYIVSIDKYQRCNISDNSTMIIVDSRTEMRTYKISTVSYASSRRTKHLHIDISCDLSIRHMHVGR